MDIKIFLRNDFVNSIDLQQIREKENKFTVHFGNKQTWTELEDIDGRLPRKIKSYITNIILYDLIEYDYKHKKRKFITKRGATAVVKSTNQSGICLIEVIGKKMSEVRSLYYRIVCPKKSEKKALQDTNSSPVRQSAKSQEYQKLLDGNPVAFHQLFSQADEERDQGMESTLYFPNKN